MENINENLDSLKGSAVCLDISRVDVCIPENVWKHLGEIYSHDKSNPLYHSSFPFVYLAKNSTITYKAYNPFACPLVVSFSKRHIRVQIFEHFDEGELLTLASTQYKPHEDPFGEDKDIVSIFFNGEREFVKSFFPLCFLKGDKKPRMRRTSKQMGKNK